MSASNQLFCRSDLRAGVETLEVKHVGLNEVLLHLVELVAADGVDVTALQLLLKDLWNGNLTQISAHTEKVAVQHKAVPLILHLGGESSLVLLLRGELLGGRWVIISVRFIAHFYWKLNNYII